MATDIAALAASKCFDALKAPIQQITAPHVPVPFSPALEDLYIPSVEQIMAAAEMTMKHKGRVPA
jgi:acetoin:2,6-dichlorophenolindophenol oxidoreductase subunit beta